MKRCHCLMFLLLMGMSFPGLSWAQDVINYKMLVNDPTLVPTSYIDIVYFDYEGSMANQNKWHKAVNGLGSSVIAEVKPAGKIGLQGKMTFYWYDRKNLFVKAPIHLEAGGVMSLRSKIKEQEIKVTLRSFKTKVNVVDANGTWQGRTDAIAEEFIMVTAKKEFRTWGRAGVLFRRTSYRPFVDRSPQLGSQTFTGLYAGFELTRKAHVEVQLADRQAISAEYIKFYGDLMVFPVAAHSTVDRNKKTPVGFRLGMTGKLPGMKHFLNYMAPKVEIGMWPLDGMYWSVGFSMNVYRS